MFLGSDNIPVPIFNISCLLHQVVPTMVSGVKSKKAKIFLLKSYQDKYIFFIHITYQCQDTKYRVYSTRWCRVSKQIMAKFFPSKFTPSTTFWKVYYDQFSRNRHLPVLSLITGQPVSGLGKRKKISMYQHIDHRIHLEFLESDVPFSKTYKSIWLCLFRLSKHLSRVYDSLRVKK